MSDHPFHKTLRQVNMTDAEKIAIASVSRLMTTPPFRSCTPEEVWDALLLEANRFLSAGSMETRYRFYTENLLRELSKQMEQVQLYLKEIKNNMATKSAQQRLADAQTAEATELQGIKTSLASLKSDAAGKFTELEDIIKELRDAAGSGDADVINAAADKAEAVVSDLKDLHSGLSDLDTSVQSQSGAPATPAPTAVTITPTSVDVAAGAQTTFSTNVPANYSALSGSVDANGVYTAPTDPTIASDTVTATSQADGSTATASVNITTVAPPAV
jgi:DNA-binding transcriptional MerR regulator